MPAPSSQRRLLPLLGAVLAACGLVASCTRPDYQPTAVVKDGVVVSVRDQKMAVMREGKIVKTYPVSTSKFGLGDSKGSCRTPLGMHRIASKIGAGQPKGMVFKSRQPTGECVAPNSPGRDPIVTRIMWLEGLESRNRNARNRMIYIHGTAEERTIGSPASYGCIRMTSNDVYEAFNLVSAGDPVVIERCSIKASLKALTAMEQAEASGTLPQTPQLAVVSAPVNTAPVVARRGKTISTPAVAMSRQKAAPARKRARAQSAGHARHASRQTSSRRA